MARTQHLPLYSAAYVFAREAYKIKAKLPKVLKYDLGQEVFQSALKILKYVVIANRSREKKLHIQRLLLEVESQWAFLRLLYDLKGISEGEYKVLSGRLSDIGKQSEAWMKWEQSKAPDSSSPTKKASEAPLVATATIK